MKLSEVLRKRLRADHEYLSESDVDEVEALETRIEELERDWDEITIPPGGKAVLIECPDCGEIIAHVCNEACPKGG